MYIKKENLLILLICMLTLDADAQNEVVIADRIGNYKLEYGVTATGDTLLIASYFIINGDTLNRMDVQGNKTGRWMEAIYQETVVNLDTIIRIDDFANIHKQITVNPNKNILMIVSPKLNIKPREHETESCFFREEEPLPREGEYLEEYWFGYLKGTYKNGLRRGRWEFIPRNFSSHTIIVWSFDDFSNRFPVFNQNRRTIKVLKISSFEEGNYISNKRQGAWVWDTGEYAITKKSFYQNGSLESTWINTGATDWKKVEQISMKDDTVILTFFNKEGNIRATFDISHLPARIKSIGERPFFYLYPLK